MREAAGAAGRAHEPCQSIIGTTGVGLRIKENAIGKMNRRRGIVPSAGKRRTNAGGKKAAPKRPPWPESQKPSPDGARTNAQSCGECVSIICWNGARCPYAIPDTSNRQTAATRGENVRCRAPS